MQLTKETNIGKLANTLAILGDSSRLAIVCYLMDSKANVSEITSYIGMSQPSISHHLRLLKDARILKAEKKGKQVYYSLNDDHIKTIIESGLIHMVDGE